MKVLILSDARSVHIKRWIKALSEHGIKIYLFSLNATDVEYYSQFPDVKVFHSNLEDTESYKTKLKYPFAVHTVKQLIKSVKPDIVHAHYASSYGLIGALAKTHVPYIVSVWGSDVYDFPNETPFGKKIIKFNLKRADYILSTSYVMAKETKKYTNKSISITPFGVETDRFKVIGNPSSDEFVIGTVKTLRPKYGIDILIKAANIVIRNNPSKKIRLEIYGDGSQKDELINLTKSLGIEDKVLFKGFIQNDKLPAIYNSLSVAVSLSVLNSESFGVVAVEAMACGCPVVTSDADGFTEVVKNEETGFIVPKRNPEATANAIQRFLDNPDLRSKMGAAGRERVKKMYDWNDNVNTMINIYRKVIENNEREL